MTKDLARALRAKAVEVGGLFSRPDRAKNPGGETFSLIDLRPLSEATAVAYYRKAPSKKLALAFFYYLNAGHPRWEYFFPTDSHVLGMGKVADLLTGIEHNNFPLNFPPKEAQP